MQSQKKNCDDIREAAEAGGGGWNRSGGLKGVARNILASPRAPSCVLNHFPVDSAVCNPIIGVSPPGKLLFYSRTTRAPGVPYTAIFSVFLSLDPYMSRRPPRFYFLVFSLALSLSLSPPSVDDFDGFRLFFFSSSFFPFFVSLFIIEESRGGSCGFV